MKNKLGLLSTILTVVVLLICVSIPIYHLATPDRVDAATTAEWTVTATGEFIAITDNVTSYDFGTGAASSTSNLSTSYVGITNTSTVQTDMTLAVTDNWTSGGSGWTHDNTGTAGANTAAMKAQRGADDWGLGTVINVQTLAGSPEYIYENCPATTSFDYGVSLLYPSSFTDGEQNSNTVRVTAAAG